MPIYNSRAYPESALAHHYLDGLRGLEIGGAYHNAFGLDTLNVDYTDAMDTEAKRLEISTCGTAMPVDIISPGDKISVPDKSFDFVISSHVIEHFYDPIRALSEWRRIARRYIYVICPQPDALPSDRGKSLTEIGEIRARNGAKPPVSFDPSRHHSRWTSRSFVAMCQHFRFNVVAVQDPDDKVGNGFAVVIDAEPPNPLRWLATKLLSRV